MAVSAVGLPEFRDLPWGMGRLAVAAAVAAWAIPIALLVDSVVPAPYMVSHLPRIRLFTSELAKYNAKLLR